LKFLNDLSFVAAKDLRRRKNIHENERNDTTEQFYFVSFRAFSWVNAFRTIYLELTLYHCKIK